METTLELDEESIVALTELLVGAAYADEEFHELEKERIKELVRPYVDNRDLADRVARRLLEFDPDAFSIEDTVDKLEIEGPDEREAVLAMVGEVADADFVHDFAESAYVDAVAEAMEAEPEEFRRHTVEIIEEEE